MILHFRWYAGEPAWYVRRKKSKGYKSRYRTGNSDWYRYDDGDTRLFVRKKNW